MVGTIGLAGSRARDGHMMSAWWKAVGGPYAIGAVGAGGLLGVIMAFLGALLGTGTNPFPLWLVTGPLAMLAAADVVGVPAKYASRARQLPLSWKHVYPTTLSAVLFGLALGSGFATTVYFWNFYALMLGVLVLGSLKVGVIAGLAFGAGRAAPVFATPLVGGVDAGTRRMDAMFEGLGRHPRVARLVPALATTGLMVSYIRLA